MVVEADEISVYLLALFLSHVTGAVIYGCIYFVSGERSP